MAVLTDALLLIALAVCLYTDLSKRKIYNKVVLPAAALGVFLNTVGHGLRGLKFSAAGFCLGILLFIVPYALGGMGAGDVKLLGAVGALKGPLFVFHAALGTALAGGAMAVIVLIWRRRFWETAKRLALACALFLGFRRGAGDPTALLEKKPYSPSFPYGAAIFMGVLWAYWFQRVLFF